MSKIKIFLACTEANHVCDKSQYKEASFLEKIKLSIHLLYCKACRSYSATNKKLTDLISESKTQGSHFNLDQNTKIKLEQLIEKELANNHKH